MLSHGNGNDLCDVKQHVYPTRISFGPARNDKDTVKFGTTAPYFFQSWDFRTFGSKQVTLGVYYPTLGEPYTHTQVQTRDRRFVLDYNVAG